MNTLISTTEVLRRAFRPEERLPADTVREADVVVAEWPGMGPVIPAASNIGQLEANASAATLALSDEQAAEILNAIK